MDSPIGSAGRPVTTPQAIDRDLLAIRAALTREIEGPFHFWTPGVAELWDSSPTGSATTAVEAAELERASPAPLLAVLAWGAGVGVGGVLRKRHHGHRLGRARRPRDVSQAGRRSGRPSTSRGRAVR